MKMMAGEFFSASSNALRRLLSDSPAHQGAGSHSLSTEYRVSSHSVQHKQQHEQPLATPALHAACKNRRA